MTVYSGTYQDKFGTQEIKITNDFNEFSFKLDDFNFIGRHFDDFKLDDHHHFTTEQLKRFTFKPIDIYQSDKKVFELRDFILSFTVPVGKIPAAELLKSIPSITKKAIVQGEQIASIGSYDMTVDIWIKLARRINEIFAKNEAEPF